MTIPETEDLLDKHMVHHDYFSFNLHNLLVKRSDSTLPQPAVIADAFYNSIRGYKGRLFLMGKYEFVIGSLSNWADRLLDVMESGGYIRAIKLATAYYLGEEDFVSVGLPADESERHAVVLRSIPNLISASFGYTFQSDHPDEASIAGLTDACITAVVAMNETDLLTDIFELFEPTAYRKIFFEQLSSFIYDGDIKSLPPRVFKELVLFYSTSSDVLEDLTCRLRTDTLDIDLIFSLCRQYHLRDTLTYITNCALRDFKTPLVDFVNLIEQVSSIGEASSQVVKSDTLEWQSTKSRESTDATDNVDLEQLVHEADKVYPYLSYILTGRIYPTALLFTDEGLSYYGKCATYYMLFSGKVKSDTEVRFPYLIALINYNSSAFFAALNEGFEDTFMNGSDRIEDGDIYPPEELAFGSTVSRQLIINILLDVFYDESNGLGPDKRIFLDIFIARNYPKYLQFILLPGKVLSKILYELCYWNDASLKEEREIAVNSLLTKFKPPDLENLTATLYEVKFHSILIYLFRSEKKYTKLLEVAFESVRVNELEADRLFDIIEECLQNTRGMSQTKERGNLDRLLGSHFEMLVELDSERLVQLVSKFCAHIHDLVFKLNSEGLQLRYLNILFKAVGKSDSQGQKFLPTLRTRTLYISLLAKNNNSAEIYRLLSTILTSTSDVDLPSIVDSLISSKSIDSLVLLLERQGRIGEAMIYLLDHILFLNDEYMLKPTESESGLNEHLSPEVTKLEDQLSRYTAIGVNLCLDDERRGTQGESQNPGEAVWIRLIDTLIDLLKDTLSDDKEKALSLEHQKQFKHSLLRQALSALLGSPANINGFQHDATIVRIFRSILAPESTKTRTVGSLRPLLDDMFSAYNYQHTMLCVVEEILDSDTYLSLLDLVSERLKGWKVSKSGECEGCGRKVVGVGVDAEWLYSQWEKRQKEKTVAGFNGTVRKDKGKSKYLKPTVSNDTSREQDEILIVFKCGHTYHKGCLKRLGNVDEIKCIICG
ncbi:CORVET complex membrane-binding subunit VPS8 [Sugiyamaella lignohabitans]|uniref:CORVET complex membrane-binding subunit VPS8 n=1 Tax=Sugiyamaella lignohabitans TaxID=796027 RepID=A0A167CYI2_9ASCO|nr:CORVET complex membrane-binding subunit VPS8 [Sugiyamaella lignohabitans]ANB12260.1 CORVET complex membrane-binding subunit VPS8 [Sugiyamaella lignohabitans]